MMFSPKRFLKPVAGALISLAILLSLEAALRVGAFVWYDFSRYYLFFGVQGLAGRFAVDPSFTHTGKHYKFPPNYVLRGAAGQAEETAAINSLGFRGPDFQPRKPPGTFRVVCLGESSTFGFHNRDDETYPFLLERLFREQPSGLEVEIVNAGFPYYNSGSILSLLQEEILRFDPDLLTVYSGYNDVGWPLHWGAVGRFSSWLQEHSLAYFLMKQNMLTDARVTRWQRGLSRRFGRRDVDLDAFEAHASAIARRYRKNYEAILSLARSRGIPVILIKQPMTARYTHIQKAGYAQSYEAEYQEVLKELQVNKFVSPVEQHLLIHHRLLEELEAIAQREQVDLVDNVALLDRNRRLMASYVHLTGEANLNLARALKAAIEKHLPNERSAR